MMMGTSRYRAREAGLRIPSMPTDPSPANTSRRPALPIALCVGLLALAVHAPGNDLGLSLGDEGYLVSGIERVRAGEVLYRDVVRNYAPANFIVLGWLFDLTGTDLLVLVGADDLL